jgi:hypothetical protein
MDKAEAQLVLSQVLTRYRNCSYEELRSLVEQSEDSWHSETFERDLSSGAKYQIDIAVFFDDKEKCNLRVRGAIDNGGWRALAPLCDDFIMSPDGSFVGE